MHSCNSDTEEKAATILGRILFELSRLEMELGLCIVWIEGGSQLEQLTRKHEYSTFNERLGFLRGSVDRLLPAGSKRHTAYTDWLDQANKLRKLRNEFIHGRWGIDLPEERVVNVIGMPTSPSQKSVVYSLEQFKQVLDSVSAIRIGLSTLRVQWPL